MTGNEELKEPYDLEEIEKLCDKYYDADEDAKIVDLLLKLPENKLNVKLIGSLIAAYNNTGRYEEAIACSEKYRDRCEGDMAEWYYRVAYAYIKKKEYEKAIEAIDCGLKAGIAENNDRCIYRLNEMRDACMNELAAIESRVFGRMVFDKQFHRYRGTGIWCGREVKVILEVLNGENNIPEQLKLLEDFFEKQDVWDRKIREFAAVELTEQANVWLEDEAEDDGEEAEMITEEDFARCITMEVVELNEGELRVCFGDDGMFAGHIIAVYGDVEKGLEMAQMEG